MDSEKQKKLEEKRKELYRKEYQKEWKRLSALIGKDVSPDLGVLLAIKVLADILSVKDNPDSETVTNNIISELGRLSMVNSMEALREVDPGKFLDNIAFIGRCASMKENLK